MNIHHAVNGITEVVTYDWLQVSLVSISMYTFAICIPGPPPKVRHISNPPSRFLVGLVQKSRTKVSCTNSLSIVRGGFFRVGFCPFPLLSQYICYNRKLNITLNFMFYMYDKNLYKLDVTCP